MQDIDGTDVRGLLSQIIIAYSGRRETAFEVWNKRQKMKCRCVFQVILFNLCKTIANKKAMKKVPSNLINKNFFFPVNAFSYYRKLKLIS